MAAVNERLIKKITDRNGIEILKFDEWDTRNEENHTSEDYDIFEIYSDLPKNEHGENVSVKYPPSFLRIVDEMIARRVIPAIKTRTDFARDAAVHRLKVLSLMVEDPSLNRDIRRYVMMEDTRKELNRIEQYKQQIGEALHLLTTMRDEGDEVSIEKYIKENKDRVQDVLPEPYLTQYIQTLDKFS